MLQYAIKIALTATLIVAIAEISKRHSGLAALIAALPVTSLLAFVWLYADTGRAEAVAVAELSGQIVWLVIPSLVLFITLPVLIRWGWGFWPSLLTACGLTSAAYLVLLPLLRRLGVML